MCDQPRASREYRSPRSLRRQEETIFRQSPPQIARLDRSKSPAATPSWQCRTRKGRHQSMAEQHHLVGERHIRRQVVVRTYVDVPQSGHQVGTPEVDLGVATCRGGAAVGTDRAEHVDSRSAPAIPGSWSRSHRLAVGLHGGRCREQRPAPQTSDRPLWRDHGGAGPSDRPGPVGRCPEGQGSECRKRAARRAPLAKELFSASSPTTPSRATPRRSRRSDHTTPAARSSATCSAVMPRTTKDALGILAVVGTGAAEIPA